MWILFTFWHERGDGSIPWLPRVKLVRCKATGHAGRVVMLGGCQGYGHTMLRDGPRCVLYTDYEGGSYYNGVALRLW